VPFKPSGMLDEDIDERERLELAIEARHSRNMSIKKGKDGDEDYERHDLEDADEEELEDKIVAMS